MVGVKDWKGAPEGILGAIIFYFLSVCWSHGVFILYKFIQLIQGYVFFSICTFYSIETKI